MEKINSLIVLLIAISNTLFAQITKTSDTDNLHAVHKEMNVEFGMGHYRVFDDTLNQAFLTIPFFTVRQDNYLSEKLMYSFIANPFVLNQRVNEKGTYRIRNMQVEAGISGSYAPVNNLWIALGGGYSYRFLAKTKTGANAWQEINFEQPGFLLFASVEYWWKTYSGLRFSTTASKEGCLFKTGLFINIRTMAKKMKPRKSVY